MYETFTSLTPDQNQHQFKIFCMKWCWRTQSQFENSMQTELTQEYQTLVLGVLLKIWQIYSITCGFSTWQLQGGMNQAEYTIMFGSQWFTSFANVQCPFLAKMRALIFVSNNGNVWGLSIAGFKSDLSLQSSIGNYLILHEGMKKWAFFLVIVNF